MNTHKLALVLAVAACGGAAPQTAEPGHEFQTERVHQAGQVRLWVPPGWQVDESGGDALVMTAPDQAVSLEVTVLDGKDLGTALLGVATSALIGYDDVKLVGAPTGGKINGMDALFQDGEGRFHGREVELSVGVIDTPAEKFLLVVGEADKASYQAHAGEIRQFVERIRPLSM
jgi:hypothetical protein